MHLCVCIFVCVLLSSPLLSSPLLRPQSVWKDRKIPLGGFIIATQLWICVHVWNGLCHLSRSLSLASVCVCVCVCVCVWWINSVACYGCVCMQVMANQWHLSERDQNLSSQLRLSFPYLCRSVCLSVHPPSILSLSLSLSRFSYIPRRSEGLEGQRVKTQINHREWVSGTGREEREMEGETM